MPSPNLLMLDKELALAEFLNINSIICINKTDLNETKANEIYETYTKTGYNVIKTKAEENVRNRRTKKNHEK